MIYTSYFSALRRIPAVQSGELRAVSIALYPPPQWSIDSQAFALRPWPFMVNQYRAGTLSAAEYERFYRDEILINVDPFGILKRYDNSVLCCFESPDKFCHRHIVRKWIREETGVEVMEITAEPSEYGAQKIPPAQIITGEQLSLF